MRTLRVSLLAGIAAVALAGFSGWAHAQSAQIHTMTVRLPGGGIEQIEYTGNTPPQVSVSTGPAALAATPTLFGPDSLFARMDRISAEMDRQATALFRQTAALANNPNLLTQANLASMPAGSQSYTFVSTASPGGMCEQSVQVTATGNGPPQVVRHTSGNCAPVGGSGATIGLPTAQPTPQRPHAIMTRAHRPMRARPDVVLTSAKGTKPYAGLVKAIPNG
ncbi:MAG TPA: hypothetical protein VGG57_19195 [Stellaceae bacterium]